MNKICTSIEQSKKLIELGIDVNTADMFWDTAEPLERIVPTVGPISDYYDVEDWAIPAWSLSALLELIPNWTMDKTSEINLICNPYYHCEVCYENPIDAAFEMICWLLENKKI